MTKTLADMTPEQQHNCIGMWCEAEPEPGNLFVIDEFYPEARNGHQVGCVEPGNYTALFQATEVTPRFDLPRAWTPDGQPVPGDWEHNTIDHSHIFINDTQSIDMPHGTPVRRYATNWTPA